MGARFGRSRLLSGEYHELSDQNFSARLSLFSADVAAQAEIAAARCQDTCVGPAAHLVEIHVKAGGNKSGPAESEVPAHIPLSPDTERAFAFLRKQCRLDPDLEKHQGEGRGEQRCFGSRGIMRV